MNQWWPSHPVHSWIYVSQLKPLRYLALPLGINITCTASPGSTRVLTHWGRVMHRCDGNLTNIGSDNGLSLGRRQAIIWTNVGILLIGPLGTNFSEILITIHTLNQWWPSHPVHSWIYVSQLEPLRYLALPLGINITCTASPGSTRVLTDWGRVMHRCDGNLTNIGSDNGLSLGRRQAIIWTNVGILLIGPLGTNFSEILITIHTLNQWWPSHPVHSWIYVSQLEPLRYLALPLGINITCTASPGSTRVLTDWGRVMHRCDGNLTNIGSDNDLSPGRRQAIIWTNVGILLIGPLGTNFSEILITIHTFSFKKMHLKMSSGKCRPFCLGLNELRYHSLPLRHQWLM